MKRFILLVVVMMMLAACVPPGEVFIAKSKEAMKAPTHKEAIEHYGKDSKINVHSHKYYSGLADIHAYYGHYVEAVNAYTRAIRNSNKAIYHLKRGRAYMRLHIYRDAIIDFSYVVQLRGKTLSIAYVERAKAHVEMGDFKSAISDLNKAKKRGGESVTLLVAMGELQYKMGKYADAKTYIQKAIQHESMNPELYYLRAKVFYKEKDAFQAIADLNKALEIDKGHLDAKRMLAWIYSTNTISTYRNGEIALKFARELFEINNDLEYVEVVAAAYAETGQFAKAIDVLKEGIIISTDLVQKEDFRFDILTYEKEENIRVW
ncbi:MAG: hypothetical protein C0603_05680 [Denitrovibrio sp.]|nr:MAG: hypothetical protein C0603_05680 [Denitrovibrio sp.]